MVLIVLIPDTLVGSLTPRGGIVKDSVLLGQFHRSTDDLLEVFVIPNLGKPRQRVVLSKGVSFKSIVGQQSVEVWVIHHVDSKHIPVFTLGPLGTGVEVHHRWKGLMIIHQTDNLESVGQGVGQKLVDHSESLGCGGSVNHIDCGKGGVLKTFLIPKVSEDQVKVLGSHVDLEFRVVEDNTFDRRGKRTRKGKSGSTGEFPGCGWGEL